MAEAEAQSKSLNAEELLELLRSDGDQDDCQAGVVNEKVRIRVYIRLLTKFGAGVGS